MILRELLTKIKGGYPLISPIIVCVCDEGSLMNTTLEETATRNEVRTWSDEYTREYADNKVVFVGENSVRTSLDTPVSVGRSRSCDVRIKNESVSKHHASIVLDRKRGAYYVVDQDSRNGTYINGTKLAPNARADIGSGFYVSFGDAVFVFLDAPTLRKLSRLTKQ